MNSQEVINVLLSVRKKIVYLSIIANLDIEFVTVSYFEFTQNDFLRVVGKMCHNTVIFNALNFSQA